MSDRTPGSSARPSGNRPELVLLIDDDAGIRYVLQEVLRHHGFQAETAATVEEAEKIKQRLGAEAIGVVIIDVHLTPNPRFQEGYTLYEEWSMKYKEWSMKYKEWSMKSGALFIPRSLFC